MEDLGAGNMLVANYTHDTHAHCPSLLVIVRALVYLVWGRAQSTNYVLLAVSSYCGVWSECSCIPILPSVYNKLMEEWGCWT